MIIVLSFRSFLLVYLFLGIVNLCLAQEKQYKFNSSESCIAFEIKHLGVLTVNGTFENFNGNLILVDRNPESMVCTIEVKSINTSDANRDKILCSEAYLDTKGFPTITFVSRQLLFKKNNLLIVQGDLEIKNVAKKIKMQFQVEYTKGRESISLESVTKLKRSEFNLDFGTMNGLIGNDILVNLKLIGSKV